MNYYERHLGDFAKDTAHLFSMTATGAPGLRIPSRAGTPSPFHGWDGRLGMKRKAISKRLRFEVFKRDSFVCQYCGAHPPGVMLHVDHIHPVADGGGNEIDNLITSCEACNLGKGAVSLTSIPMSLAEKAARVAEQEAQILGYQAVLEAKLDRVDEELWRVAEVIEPGSGEKGMLRDWTSSIKKFNEALGVHSVIECAEIARTKYPYGGKRTFLYFCGICWNRIRSESADA
ncbi:MAG: HNH endonuclease [Mizugakiibacter sp.]|uniref:HNH endonuclease n=1 Tax=Mizugakiibacter sp. TaxID=1972610 RepID=UPI00320F356D